MKTQNFILTKLGIGSINIILDGGGKDYINTGFYTPNGDGIKFKKFFKNLKDGNSIKVELVKEEEMTDLKKEIEKRINELGRIVKKEDNNILLKLFANKGIELNAKILTELKRLEDEIDNIQTTYEARNWYGEDFK